MADIDLSTLGAAIKTSYEAEANAFTDTKNTKLAQAVTADGLQALTGNWDVGAFSITALQFHSDIVTGTAPFTVASTTVVANLNVSALEGNAAAAFATAAQGALADTAQQPRNTVTAVTSSAGVVNLNHALGDYFTLALSEAVTSLTFSNLPGAGKGSTLMLRITQDATPRAFAWPASFKWAGGVAGVISTASGAIDVLAITTFDNGTTWDATLADAFA